MAKKSKKAPKAAKAAKVAAIETVQAVEQPQPIQEPEQATAVAVAPAEPRRRMSGMGLKDMLRQQRREQRVKERGY